MNSAMNQPTPSAAHCSGTWHARAYFGLHYDLHAGAKDTELGAALTPEHLRAELDKIKPDFVQCDCKGHAGYTSWPTEVGTPSPGIVRDALRIHRDVTRAMGIPLVMHYSGVWDNRAIEVHPDWARVGPDGTATGKEGFVTGATCNLSDYTAELMIPQMLELIDKYDVDGFWVDGENWATKTCYCERCKTEFTRRSGISAVPQAPGEANWTEWANFHREIFAEHVRLYADAIHARKPECAVCSNWMYTVGHPEPIDVPVDYLSGDFSWKWSLPAALLEGRFMDGRRLNSPGITWDLMAWAFTTGEEQMGGWTFKHAPGLCQEAAAVIGLGGSFLMYNNPQRSGHLTGWQQDIMAEVARFAFARRPWCEGTVSVPQAAVLHNPAHFYDKSGEVLMAAWSGAQKPVNGALHALLENHLAVDVLAEDATIAHLDKYALLVIPEQTLISDALHATITAWVERGGRLLLSGTETVPRFAELAGVAADGELREGFFSIGVDGETTTTKGPWLPLKTAGAQELHHIFKAPDPHFNEATLLASTLRQVGEGLVVAVPGPLFGYFADTHYPRTRKLVGQLIGALHPEMLVTMEAPARVHLMLRRKGNQLILHLLNTGTGHPLAPSAVVVEDVPRVGPVKLFVKLGGAPRSVYLAPAMEGLAWTWDGSGVHIGVESIGIMDSVIVETG